MKSLIKKMKRRGGRREATRGEEHRRSFRPVQEVTEELRDHRFATTRRRSKEAQNVATVKTVSAV